MVRAVQHVLMTAHTHQLDPFDHPQVLNLWHGQVIQQGVVHTQTRHDTQPKCVASCALDMSAA